MPSAWVKKLVRQSMEQEPSPKEESESPSPKELPRFSFKSIPLPKPKPKTERKTKPDPKIQLPEESKPRSSTGLYVILGIVAIAVLGYFGYRWIKKKQDSQREADYWN